MEELNLQEIDDVSGGRINGTMLEQAGILIVVGGLAIATGGFACVAVGSVALAMGGVWGGLSFTER